MSKTKQVDIRGVKADQKTDGLIEVFIGRQKVKGRDLKKGDAVLELVKRGLEAEGITA